jgi:hypothetical protein
MIDESGKNNITAKGMASFPKANWQNLLELDMCTLNLIEVKISLEIRDANTYLEPISTI